MLKILISGSSGFIGRHLTEKLNNYPLIGLIKNKNIDLKIQTICKDIRQLDLDDFPNDISHIIHTAALSDLQYCEKNKKECYDINVGGTKQILEIAKKNDSKVIFLSTSHVYGKPIKLPLSESHELNPSSVYSQSKVEAEKLCKIYNSKFNIPISILRLFSVYGPYSPDHLVTTRIIKEIILKNNISIGNLFPKRDFIHIYDVVNAIELLLNYTNSFQVFNIGSGQSNSIETICNYLIKISNKKILVESINSLSRSDDVPNVISDISKIKNLGWIPKINLFDGLKITYDSFVKQLK